MNFAILDQKEDLDVFIRRTYPRATDADRKRIGEALLAANPALKTPAGQRTAPAVVVLPEVGDSKGEGTSPASVARMLITAVRDATPELRTVLASRAAAEQSRLDERTAALKSAEVKQIKDPDVRKQIDAITALTDQAQKDLQAAAKDQDAMVSALEKDLTTILGDTPPTTVKPPSTSTPGSTTTPGTTTPRPTPTTSPTLTPKGAAPASTGKPRRARKPKAAS